MRALMYHRSYGDPELARTVFRQLPEAARRGLAGFDYGGGGTGVSARPDPLRNGCGEAEKLFA